MSGGPFGIGISLPVIAFVNSCLSIHFTVSKNSKENKKIFYYYLYLPDGDSSIMVSVNKLTKSKRAQVVAALVEGNSIRSTVRMTVIAKDTIVKLLADHSRN